MLYKGEYLWISKKTLIQLIVIFYWHDLLLDGVSNNALKLMCSYLENRKDRTQINKSFSSEKN